MTVIALSDSERSFLKMLPFTARRTKGAGRIFLLYRQNLATTFEDDEPSWIELRRFDNDNEALEWIALDIEFRMFRDHQ